MAYDEALAERVRAQLEGNHLVTERVMFGGLSFLLSGNLACGVIGDELCVPGWVGRPVRRHCSARDPVPST